MSLYVLWRPDMVGVDIVLEVVDINDAIFFLECREAFCEHFRNKNLAANSNSTVYFFRSTKDKIVRNKKVLYKHTAVKKVGDVPSPKIFCIWSILYIRQ